MIRRRLNGKMLLGVVALLILLCHISTVTEGVRSTLLLCAHTIVPSVLMFVLLSDCIVNSAADIIDTPRDVTWLLFFLGTVCGFPIGAAVCDRCVRRGILSERDAARMLPFCNNASPAFLLGVVGTRLYEDIRIGWLIFCVQTLISAAAFFWMGRSEKTSAYKGTLPPSEMTFMDSVENAAALLLRICVLVCFFSGLLSVVRVYLPSGAYILLAALAEIGNGTAASAMLPKPFGILLCAFACGWSGGCVHMQILFASRSIKVKVKRYLFSKFAVGVLTAVGTFALYKLCLGT